MSSKDGLRILKAVIKNFKNIDYREIDIEGRSIVVAGKNEAGKSSFIQALASPLNSKYVPIEPIKEGEEKGELHITIGGKLEGEEIKYKISTFFTQGNKRGRLAIFNATGEQIKGSERTVLDTIIGDISFDIMEFVELGTSNTGQVSKSGVKKQIEMIKELLPAEVLKQLDELDVEKSRIYEERTDVNRDIKLMKGQIEKNGFTQEEIEMYSEEKSVSDLTEQIRKAEKFNDAYDKAQHFDECFNEDLHALHEDLKEIQARIDAMNEKKKQVDAFFDKNPQKKDVKALEEQLENLSAFNTKVAQVKAMDQQQADLKEKETQSENITERLKAIDEEKKAIFSNAKMPVKGLAFDEESVTYKGLPLSEGNVPTSTLIGIGAKIGMAMNPNLRLLVIKRGESLDEERMETVLKICEKQGFQLLIEKVDSSKEKLELEFVEK